MDGYPIRKMEVERAADGAVGYSWRAGLERFPVNALLGGTLHLRATGARSCTVCGTRVRKFYGQSYCYPCFRDAPEASPCIIRPELCRAHLGEGRDPAWEQANHAQEHVVYLAQTGVPVAGAKGGIKVGVTRSTQIPTRWIDQGAVLAVPIACVPNRYLAGVLEVALKAEFADRTDYRALLKPLPPMPDAMADGRERALSVAPEELGPHMVADAPLLDLRYPGQLPPVVKAVSLEKVPELGGSLVAVRGQYLVWADGRALNVRGASGLHVEWEFSSGPV